jgi:hypothetical protein
MPGGRPLKFESVEKLKEDCDKFFNECDEKEEPYTITGLALALKTCRQTLLTYEEKSEFLDTIKEAKLKCENYAEKRSYSGNAAGPIFCLKNYGWSDKLDLNVGGKLGLSEKTDDELQNEIKRLQGELADSTKDTGKQAG